MKITISDERIIERLQQLADELHQTPEQVVADAINQFSPTPQETEKTFWNAIRGIADSGDPDLAYRVKDIVRQEVDPIEGWKKPGDTKNSD